MTSSTELSGLLVVSVEQAVAAPYAASRLADAGARVIKIERPEGDFARRYDHAVDGESAYFVWLNRGKESVILDLREAADKALLEALIAKADVFIQNLAPGALDRMGLGPKTLRRKHPKLIICSISGYGEEGPRAHLKAYDLLVQAETGLSEITGEGESRVRVGVSICDIAAGMTAFQAILQALIGRSITSEGRLIEVSLYHALADWMNVPYLQHVYGGLTPLRMGLNHATIAPYGAYSCGDGRPILFSIQNEREWAALCAEVLGDAAIASDPRFSSNTQRVANRAALDAIIADVFARFDREAMANKLESAKIAYGRVSSLPEMAVHPQNRYVEVDTPAGRKKMLAPGAIVDGGSPAMRPVPALGAHTARVRAEFGG